MPTTAMRPQASILDVQGPHSAAVGSGACVSSICYCPLAHSLGLAVHERRAPNPEMLYLRGVHQRHRDAPLILNPGGGWAPAEDSVNPWLNNVFFADLRCLAGQPVGAMKRLMLFKSADQTEHCFCRAPKAGPPESGDYGTATVVAAHGPDPGASPPCRLTEPESGNRQRKTPQKALCLGEFRWCCRCGLNTRPLPYQGSALPLSYGSNWRPWPAGQGRED